jgi:hypothetical protein
MAHIEEVFKILRDDSTGAGEAPISRIEGEAALTKEGLIGFSFKDQSNNVILPQLDSSGRIPVTTQAAGAKLYADAQDVAGSTASFQDVATITLAVDTEYNNVEAHGFATRMTIYQIASNDDGTPDVLAQFMVGAGQYYARWDANNLEFTTGATGTQELKLQGKNLYKVSDLGGDIGCQVTS